MYDSNKPTGATSYPGFRWKGQREREDPLMVYKSLTRLTLHTEDWAQGSKSVQKETEAPDQPLMTFPEQPRPFPVVFAP